MRYLPLAIILAILVGAIGVPFAVGFIQGPSASPSPSDGCGTRTPGAQLMRPVTRVVTIYGRFFVLYVIAEVLDAVYRAGKSPVVCANTPYSTVGGWSGIAVRPGAQLQSKGTVQVCASHPGVAQWFLYALIRLPGLVVWAIALLLVWQLIRQAARSGPFSRQSADIMQRLGVVIVVGTAVAAAVSALGADLLTRMLLVSGGYAGAGIPLDILVSQPIQALLPWPALAGAGLISFARITRVGAELDEEVRATV
jgi:hypothetical protein